MTDEQTLDPLAILKELEDLCRGNAAGQPRVADAGNEWSGIAFRVGNDCLVSQLGEVVEVLEYPQLARVPLTRSWVLGIANVRGSLLPVIDLGAWLGGNALAADSRCRVLVVDHQGMYTGLAVDEVHGLRHFTQDEYTASDPAAAEHLRPWLRNGFLSGGRVWNIFNLHDLVLAPEFLKAAV